MYLIGFLQEKYYECLKNVYQQLIHFASFELSISKHYDYNIWYNSITVIIKLFVAGDACSVLLIPMILCVSISNSSAVMPSCTFFNTSSGLIFIPKPA